MTSFILALKQTQMNGGGASSKKVHVHVCERMLKVYV